MARPNLTVAKAIEGPPKIFRPIRAWNIIRTKTGGRQVALRTFEIRGTNNPAIRLKELAKILKRAARGQVHLDDEVLLLLAEDEPMILLALQEALEDGGYAVLTASNGFEAMAVLESRLQELSGFITDIRLGEGPDGWELARRARALRSDLPIVYSTGDSAYEWTANGVPKSVVLQKPFADAQLITAISALLVQG